MAVSKKYIVGVDIGGSKINAVLFSGGKVLKNVKIPTPKNGRKFFLKKLEAIIRKLVSDVGNVKVSGIGFGVAGALDLDKGVVLNSPNLKFLNGFNIKNWAEEKLNRGVKIDNDARCFTRGEYKLGAGRGYKNVVGVTIGTGIGGGIVVDERVFYGASGSAGELGHMIINLKSQNSNLKTEDLETLTVKQARKFNFSKTAVKNFKKNLAIGVANVVNILDPQIIVIGGGARKMIKRFLPEIKIIAGKFIVSPKSGRNVKIAMGKLGENAGAIGAALLFYS